jgi:hypothetical protein
MISAVSHSYILSCAPSSVQGKELSLSIGNQLNRLFIWARRESSLRNVVLNKNKMVDNVQKVSHHFALPLPMQHMSSTRDIANTREKETAALLKLVT